MWDPAAEEIVGGYRFIICTGMNIRGISRPNTISASATSSAANTCPAPSNWAVRSCSPPIRRAGNAKSIYALDNLWDGLGALIVLDPRAKYLFSAR